MKFTIGLFRAADCKRGWLAYSLYCPYVRRPFDLEITVEAGSLRQAKSRAITEARRLEREVKR